MLTRVDCSGQTWNLLARIFGAIFTSSCFVLGPSDSLYVLPDRESINSPTSGSPSHNINIVLVASCTCDLEITTVHPLCEYGLWSRFPPGRDGANCLCGGCSSVIVYVLILIHNKCKLRGSSFIEVCGRSGPITVIPGPSPGKGCHTGEPLELNPVATSASQHASEIAVFRPSLTVVLWWLCLQKETK